MITDKDSISINENVNEIGKLFDCDMHGFLCAPKVYHYKYVTFEFHPYYGPYPLRKDGEPRKVIPKSFWAVWEEFSKLSEQEKEFYRIGGGCTIV